MCVLPINQFTSVIELSASTRLDVVWSVMMARFNTHANQVIQFARAIPGFQSLLPLDMKTLVQESMYPITLVQLHRRCNPTMNYNYFDFAEHERDTILSKFPEFQPLTEKLRLSIEILTSIEMDETETALLCCLELLHGSELFGSW